MIWNKWWVVYLNDVIGVILFSWIKYFWDSWSVGRREDKLKKGGNGFNGFLI